MFKLKCNNCNWHVELLGDKKSIQDLQLKEIKNSCSKCGKPRKFLCKKCSTIVKMHRIIE